jgi:hypothetical protein
MLGRATRAILRGGVRTQAVCVRPVRNIGTMKAVVLTGKKVGCLAKH